MVAKPAYLPTAEEIVESTRRIRQGWSEDEYRYRYHCPNLDRPRADVLADLAVAVRELPEFQAPSRSHSTSDV
jgi:hypothetical protein